jgi:hypothetical protein
MDNDLCYIFSLTTGSIYTIQKDELDKLDDLQIPLLSIPSSSCKKCYGRLYTGYNTVTKNYVLCKGCLRKYADMEYIKNKAKQHNGSK